LKVPDPQLVLPVEPALDLVSFRLGQVLLLAHILQQVLGLKKQIIFINMRCYGSGIWRFYPWIRDPGWGKKSGSGMNMPDHFPESLENVFGVKILKFFDPDPNKGSF